MTEEEEEEIPEWPITPGEIENCQRCTEARRRTPIIRPMTPRDLYLLHTIFCRAAWEKPEWIEGENGNT